MSDRRGQRSPSRPLLCVVVLVGTIAGCGSTDTPSVAEPQGRVDQNPVVVTEVDRAGFDAALVSHRGKVVLVDCWATWCLPCLAQLPHSFDLAKKHGDKLAVVTLSFDGPSAVDRISKTIASKGGDSLETHLVSQKGGSPASMEEFEIPGGALPCYKLFDAEGNLKQVFAVDPTAEKQFTSDDIAVAIDELLGQSR